MTTDVEKITHVFDKTTKKFEFLQNYYEADTMNLHASDSLCSIERQIDSFYFICNAIQ